MNLLNKENNLVVLNLKNRTIRLVSIISLILLISILIVHILYLTSQNRIDIIFIIEVILLLIITITSYILNDKLKKEFNKSYKYSKRLEDLNKYLDEKVKLRTRQLELSFEQQAESVHSEAIMGSIAQPMLHDLSAPTSALELAFLLMEDSKNDKKEIIDRATESVKQITRIITNGRELMSKKSSKINFLIAPIISTVEFVLGDKLNKAQINVIQEIDQDIELLGIPVLFERIIINVLLNAIEELSTVEKQNKVIKITTKKDDLMLYIEIVDNGKGINSSLINKIFDLKFSLKGETNLGFGLNFVKSTIERYFDGGINLESKEGEFTKFILRFSLYNN